MVRRYHEPVEVQSRPVPEATSAGAPSAFVWRDRLYVVREVLDHWRERRAWWRDAPDRPGADGDLPGPDELEQEMWRVVASAGRHRGSGVYDLAGGDPAGGRGWRLVRVAD